MSIQLITPPVQDPINIDLVRRHLRVDSTDEDTLIRLMMRAATKWVQNYQWSALITQTWEQRQDRFPGWRGAIELKINPVQPSPTAGLGNPPQIVFMDTGGNLQGMTTTGTGTVIYNGVTLPTNTTPFRLDTNTKPARLVPEYAQVWPLTRGLIDDVRVIFTAGFADSFTGISEDIQLAMLLLIGHWFWHRETISIGQTSDEIALSCKSLLDGLSYNVGFC